MSQQNPVFIPGPTNVPDRLRRVMDMQTLDHRAPDFADTFQPVLAGVKRILKADSAQVMLFPASGTGGWEAAISNTLSPGDKVLVARHGMFSHRWIDLCQRHGLDVQVIDVDWGEGAPVEQYAEALKADSNREIKAVLVCHNETATGVVSDVAGLRKALDDASHPALLFVDGVSSIASMDFRFDEWGVDIAITGSQKGFMLYTGMAILAVSQKALDASKTARLPRTFLAFDDMLNANAKGSFPYTPPLQLIFGLNESIKMLEEEGLENVFARHRRIAEGVRRAAQAWGLPLCAKRPELYSDSVTAIHVPEGFDATALINHAYAAYGVSYGVGLGEVAGKVFRIGHLGSLTDVMALTGISTIEMAMHELGYPIQLGSGTAAAQAYYSKTRGEVRAMAA